MTLDGDSTDGSTVGTQSIYNYRRISDQVITGGHPTEQQLRDAAEEGYRAVVNLAPIDSRSIPNEAELVQSLAMAYHYIPVDWTSPTPADFATFEAALQSMSDESMLIHCAANFRVTAFYSLYARKHLGWSADRAAELRASIWDGSDYPAWDAFIRSIEQTLDDV